MKAANIDFFEKVKAQLGKLHHEVSFLSRTKPDNPINKFKLGFINQVLNQANSILTGSFRPFEKFDVFDADDLPSNSDVTMILSQYLDGLEAWRCAHIHLTSLTWYWNTDDGDIRTEEPTRFRKPN